MVDQRPDDGPTVVVFDPIADPAWGLDVVRGGLVDEQALADALRSGGVGVAALDVRASEPPRPEGDALADLDNAILTPHVAASSRGAMIELHRMRAQAILASLAVGRSTGRDGLRE